MHPAVTRTAEKKCSCLQTYEEKIKQKTNHKQVDINTWIIKYAAYSSTRSRTVSRNAHLYTAASHYLYTAALHYFTLWWGQKLEEDLRWLIKD